MSKCPLCGSAVEIKEESFNSQKVDMSGKCIIIPMKVTYCLNSECSHTWIAHHEEMRVDKAVRSATRCRLNQKDIQGIRNALNFSTRSEAANFLSLNEKAFTKWEKGYFPMSDAYDLLLRLSVYSRSNYEFIKQLQEKQFKFEVEDYELLCEKQGLSWRHTQPTFTTNLNLSQRKIEKTVNSYFQTKNEVLNTSFAPIRNLKIVDPQVA